MSEFRESWQKAVSEQSQIEMGMDKETALALFLDISQVAEKSESETIKDLFQDLQKNIKHYFNAVKRSDLLFGSDDLRAIENADEAKKRSHDALISTLDALARAFDEAKLDSSWRETIGTDRHKIGQWAYLVGEEK